MRCQIFDRAIIVRPRNNDLLQLVNIPLYHIIVCTIAAVDSESVHLYRGMSAGTSIHTINRLLLAYLAKTSATAAAMCGLQYVTGQSSSEERLMFSERRPR
jgi:hypothetical protein